MELNVKLCCMQHCEEINDAYYSIKEDNSDPTAVIRIIPNANKKEIVLDKLGVRDLIEVLQMFYDRM